MSTPEAPAATAGDETAPDTIVSENDDQLAGTDPLLGSGSFIDPNNGSDRDPKEAAPAEDAAKANAVSVSRKKFSYERPSWLPEDWEMELRKRTSGATEGTVDRYYIAPSGHRCRSKNEVLNFLETGSKRKKPASNPDDMSERSATPAKKKSGGRKKVQAAFTFDFQNPPEKISWCLTYASEDSWSPCVGDRHLPHSTKQEWAAVFNHICQNIQTV